MGVSYAVENESIGGGGIGGGIGGGSSWGIVIFFLFLFAIFSGKRGMFGGDDHYEGKCGPSNCEVDKDVIDSKYQNLIETRTDADRVIADNHSIYEKQQDEKLNDSKMEVYFLKGQLADTARNAITDAKIADILCRMPKMRPEYVNSQLASVDNCGRNNNCGNGYDYN